MIPSKGEVFRWSDYRCRLISLFEIMKKIDVARLFDYSATLTRYAGHPSFWDALEARLPPGTDIKEMIDSPKVKQAQLEYLARVRFACETSELKVSVKAVDRMIFSITEGFTGKENLESQYREIRRRIEDELETLTFLLVTPSDCELYEGPREAWNEANAAFPSIQIDVEEASKCLALDRATACVFHLMRVAEIALRLIARAVGSRNPRPEWGALLSEIESSLSKKYDDMPPEIKANLAHAKETCAHMRAVNLAWRRSTMHMEKKYTKEEARNIYAAIRGLLTYISTWIEEEPIEVTL